MQRFGQLGYGPKDDPDGDGFNNAREQVMGTNPSSPNAPFKLDLVELKPGYQRLSWPARENASYSIFSSGNLSQPTSLLSNAPVRLPVGEFVVRTTSSNQFYRVRQTNIP